MEMLDNIFVIDFNKEPLVKILPKTLFENILNQDEIDEVIALYSKGKVLYNDKAVRLDNVILGDNIILELSLVNFFDFLSSNMINMNIDILKERNERLISKIAVGIKFQDINNYRDVITNKHLANIVAVSVLVRDKEGKYGFVQRSNTVAIGSNLMSVTCTGSLDADDFKSDNPIINCVKRELHEELNIIPDVIKIDSIVISKTKLQPIVVVDCYIDDTFNNCINKIKSAADYNLEITKFYAVPQDKLNQFIINEKLTDAAKYQITKESLKTKQDANQVDKQQYQL